MTEPHQATVRRELEEDAGAEGPDPGPAQAGGHSQEDQRGCRSGLGNEITYTLLTLITFDIINYRL